MIDSETCYYISGQLFITTVMKLFSSNNEMNILLRR